MEARLEAMLNVRCLKIIPIKRDLLCYRFAIIREVMQDGSHVRNHIKFRPT